MPEGTKKQIALITGGSRGIGKSISMKLSHHGMDVIITGKNRERGLEVVEQIKHDGGKAYFYIVDLENEENREHVFSGIIGQHDCVDVLINNAGISGYMGALVDTPLIEVLKAFQVNTISALHLCKKVLPGMIQRRQGRIINISSVAVKKTPIHAVTYTMSKAALNGMTLTLSKEVAQYGITVNAVAPGLVLTDRILNERLPTMAKKAGISQDQIFDEMIKQSDTKRLTGVDEISELVLYLLSPAARNITGEILTISGGY